MTGSMTVPIRIESLPAQNPIHLSGDGRVDITHGKAGVLPMVTLVAGMVTVLVANQVFGCRRGPWYASVTAERNRATAHS